MKQCMQCQLAVKEYGIDGFCSQECKDNFNHMNQNIEYNLDYFLGRHTQYQKLTKYKFKFNHIKEFFSNKCDQLVSC